MATNHDPDETAVMDINMAKRRIIERLWADGVYDADDRAAITALEVPVQTLSQRSRIRRNFESIMRNGINRYTTTNAKDAGIAFVAAGDRLDNVIPWPNTEMRRQDVGPDDAA